MHAIDGSLGEGGGQVLRTALALSLVTGQAFCIERIRAGRERPGLLRQHLACVRAAVEIGSGEADGASLGSTALTFRPGSVRPGAYRFAVGTAGSVALVLQSVLPALLVTEGDFEIVIEGGTHAEFAPPYEFLARVYVPALERMGAQVELALGRCGFYPAGGGRITARARGGALSRAEFLERGAHVRTSARALVAHLPHDIAEREAKVLRTRLGLAEGDVRVETVADSAGPGNAVLVEIEHERSTEIVSAFGSVRRSAEAVASEAVSSARRYLGASVPVGEHLADQLLLPMALAGGGAFLTMKPTRHARTNAEIIRGFIGREIRFTEVSLTSWRCEV